jgi:succinyl-CoA synthetase beta subunit
MCGKVLTVPESTEGYLCRCVYITEELDALKEFYLSVSMDRVKACPVITYGAWNGNHQMVDSPEELSDKFSKIYIDVTKGLNVSMLSEVATELGIGDKKSEMIFLLKHLYDCFT